MGKSTISMAIFNSFLFDITRPGSSFFGAVELVRVQCSAVVCCPQAIGINHQGTDMGPSTRTVDMGPKNGALYP